VRSPNLVHMADAPQQIWQPRHNPWLITLTVMMAVFMEVLDTSIANIALPAIAVDLHVSPADVVWVVNVYQIALVATSTLT